MRHQQILRRQAVRVNPPLHKELGRCVYTVMWTFARGWKKSNHCLHICRPSGCHPLSCLDVPNCPGSNLAAPAARLTRSEYIVCSTNCLQYVSLIVCLQASTVRSSWIWTREWSHAVRAPAYRIWGMGSASYADDQDRRPASVMSVNVWTSIFGGENANVDAERTPTP